jgi:hypothetical protein
MPNLFVPWKPMVPFMPCLYALEATSYSASRYCPAYAKPYRQPAERVSCDSPRRRVTWMSPFTFSFLISEGGR